MAVQIGNCDERVEAAARSACGQPAGLLPTYAIRTASRETTRGTRSRASGSEHPQSSWAARFMIRRRYLPRYWSANEATRRGQRHASLGRDRQDPEQRVLLGRPGPGQDHSRADRHGDEDVRRPRR